MKKEENIIVKWRKMMKRFQRNNENVDHYKRKKFDEMTPNTSPIPLNNRKKRKEEKKQ